MSGPKINTVSSHVSFGLGEQASGPRASGARRILVRRESNPATALPPQTAHRSEPVSLVDYIKQRHAELDRLNHFELLDIPETAGRDSIRDAHQRCLRLYHPDRLRGPHESLRPLAAEIFCRVSEAYRVLDDETSRKQYLSSLRGSASPAGGEVAEVDPNRLFQAARICLKQRRLDDAMLLISRACAADPEQVQYSALQAWVRVERGQLRPGATGDHILSVLNRAVNERRDDVEIRLYRARVLQRLGRTEEALRDFRLVAKVDRTNIEAAREVRLYHMRTSERPSFAGAVVKFFKR